MQLVLQAKGGIKDRFFLYEGTGLCYVITVVIILNMQK